MNTNAEDHANGSLKPGEPILMRQQEQAAVFKFPCDGIKRYVVHAPGGKTLGGLTYSEAYDMIWSVTGCKEDEGKKVLTLVGVQRIKALNQKYISVAGKFIREFFEEQKKKKGDKWLGPDYKQPMVKPEEPKA